MTKIIKLIIGLIITSILVSNVGAITPNITSKSLTPNITSKMTPNGTVKPTVLSINTDLNNSEEEIIEPFDIPENSSDEDVEEYPIATRKTPADKVTPAKSPIPVPTTPGFSSGIALSAMILLYFLFRK